MIVSFITDSEVELVVLDPDRNWGTTGVARVLIGYKNISSKQSLVNFYADSCRSNTACTTSTCRAGMNSRTQTCRASDPAVPPEITVVCPPSTGKVAIPELGGIAD